MAKGRDVLTDMGITKKDRKEISGCLTYMIVFPIYMIIKGIRAIISLIKKF